MNADLPSDIPAVNFTISSGAREGIDRLRASYNANSADPADVATIVWGRVMPKSGDPFETVVVTFYPRSMRASIAPAIQMVSGLEVFFFATSLDLPKFQDKVLDFAEDRGFFLRAP